MLKLRSVDLTDLWNDFWTFRTQREKNVLYEGQDFKIKELSFPIDVCKAA